MDRIVGSWVMTMVFLFLPQRWSASNSRIREPPLAMKIVVRKKKIPERKTRRILTRYDRFLSLALVIISHCF